MDYDDDRIERVIDKAVRQSGEDARPAFYAVTGSHIYGFPSQEGGDVDVRGFHVTDGLRYASLDEPREQIVVNQGDLTEGFEAYPEVDLVSYELKKFGSLLYSANFNVLEVVFDGIEVVNGVPLELSALRSLIEERLPLDVPKSYVGMARTNYWKHLNPNKSSYTPTAKKYLYVLRGLLAAQYVAQERTITADVSVLSDHVLGDTELVDELVAVKREAETVRVDDDLASRADEAIAAQFNAVDPPESVDKEDYREAIDDWMRKVRA